MQLSSSQFSRVHYNSVQLKTFYVNAFNGFAVFQIGFSKMVRFAGSHIGIQTCFKTIFKKPKKHIAYRDSCSESFKSCFDSSESRIGIRIVVKQS